MKIPVLPIIGPLTKDKKKSISKKKSVERKNCRRENLILHPSSLSLTPS